MTSDAARRRAGVSAWLFAAAFLGVGIFYYYFLGPGPTAAEYGDLPAWRPRGWITRWESVSDLVALARGGGAGAWVPVVLFWLPPAAMVAIGLRLFANHLARVGVLAFGLFLCSLAFYGYVAPDIWSFFSWRAPAALLCFAVLTAALLMSPSLASVIARRSASSRAAAVFSVLALAFLLQTEITGTDYALPYNVSPWAVLTEFGLLRVGYAIAVLHFAAGAGVWISSRIAGPSGLLASTLTAAALAALGAGLPFPLRWPAAGIGLAAVAIAYALVSTARLRTPDARVRLGREQLAAGLLVGLAIWGGDRAADAYQRTARDDTSAAVLAALEAYKAAHGTYPDTLEELVPAQLPDGVPAPRMGLYPDRGEAFVYSSFGDSYALEFPSVRWVQCQYSPPYTDPDDPDVGVGTEESESLDGSWSCASTPPPLW